MGKKVGQNPAPKPNRGGGADKAPKASRRSNAQPAPKPDRSKPRGSAENAAKGAELINKIRTTIVMSGGKLTPEAIKELKAAGLSDKVIKDLQRHAADGLGLRLGEIVQTLGLSKSA